jgi:hypothetical protein
MARRGDSRDVLRAVSENECRARPSRRVRAGDGLRRGQRRRDAALAPDDERERRSRLLSSFDDGRGRRRHGRSLARSPVRRSANARFGAGDRWRGRHDRQARASPRAAGRPRDRAPRRVCDHAPGSDASSTRNDPLSAAAVERALWARPHGEARPQAHRLWSRTSRAQHSASRCRGGAGRWAIRWAEPCRIGPYQAQPRAFRGATVWPDLQVFRRLKAPQMPCFTRDESPIAAQPPLHYAAPPAAGRARSAYSRNPTRSSSPRSSKRCSHHHARSRRRSHRSRRRARMRALLLRSGERKNTTCFPEIRRRRAERAARK